MERFIRCFLLTIIIIIIGTSTVLADVREITYQCEEEYPPYRYMDNNMYQGFEVDFSNLVFGIDDYNLRYSFDSWGNTYNNIKNGKVDICGLLAISDKRGDEILYSKPLVQLNMQFYSRKKFIKVSMGNISKYKIGVSSERFTEPILKDEFSIKNYAVYNNVNDALKALRNGDIDLLFENQDTMDHILIKHNLMGEITPSMKNVFPVNVAYGVKKGGTELVNYINGRIDELQKSGVYEEVYQRYFHSHSPYYLKQEETKKRNAILIITGSAAIIFLFLYIYILYLKRKISQTNKELYENHEHLRVTLSSIGEGVIATDRFGRITYLNRIAEKLIDVNTDDIMGAHIDNTLTIINRETGEKVKISVWQTVDIGKVQKIGKGAILVSKNGVEYPIEGSVMPIKKDDYYIIGAVVVFEDMTERRAAGEIIKRERDLSKRIFDYAGMFIFVLNNDGMLVKFSKYTETVTGYSYEEISGKKWIDVLIGQDKMLLLKNLLEQFSLGKILPAFEMPFITKDGDTVDILWNNSFMFDKNGNTDAIILMGLDITERKNSQEKMIESFQQLEAVHEELAATEEELRYHYDELRKSQEALRASEERYRLALEGAADGLWDYDIKRDKMFYSFRCMEILGYGKNVIGDSHEEWVEYIHPEDRAEHMRILKEHFSGKTDFFYHEFRMKTKDGDYKWVLSRGKAVQDSSGDMVRITGSLTDIAERKEADDIIHRMAYYDALTGLPNRTMLYSNMLCEIERVKNEGGIIGVLFMDLDNFKPINDTFGHSFGDLVLNNIANLLRNNIGEQDIVARQSGDEFVIILPMVKSIDDIKNTADRIVQLFQQPLSIKGHEIYTTVSVGVAIYPFDGSDEQTLIKNADTAMYHAKESGKSNYKFYTIDMYTKVVNKLNIESDLRHAIKNNEFEVYYQPLVDLKTGNVIGLEALARWNRPGYGCISPGDFIPIAEETGLVLTIDQYILRRACMQCISWQKAGIPPVKISVNLSARQFQQQDIVEEIKSVLEETGLEPKWLSVEITEGIALKDFNSTVDAIKKLRDLGIEVFLDDFGTGYSSLSYLKQLPIDILKIDKSFIQGSSLSADGDTIINVIIMLAKSMGISVVAEGVETYEQLQFLRDHNCDIAQGFIFSKPVAPEDIESILRRRKII